MYLVSTRFTEETWNQNKIYREKSNLPCVYCSPIQLNENKIPLNSIIYVVEMNNSKNIVEGIGIIKNFVYYDKYYFIYNERNYNRFVYKGDKYLPREKIHNELIESLEQILFKGKNHLKRGYGFTRITDKILKKTDLDIKREILKLFLGTDTG
jgi:hypothetical protein